MKKRPVSILVLAIIGIGFAIFGLLCSPVNALSTLGSEDIPFPTLENLNNTIPLPMGLKILLISDHIMSFFCSIILMVGSIGSFSMKRWSRTMMNLYALVSLVKNIIVVTVQSIIMMPYSSEVLQAQIGEVSPVLIYIMVLFQIMCALLCLGFYHCCILVFYNTKSAREAFANEGMMPPPGQYGGGGGLPHQQWGPQPPNYQSPYGPPPPPPPGGNGQQ